MSTISSLSRPPAVYGSENGFMDQAGARSFEQTSARATWKQNLDLSLKTREGDQVTINATSFSQLDTIVYDQTGRMDTGNTSSTSGFSHRTMTLETGSSFTFSVDGNLSDEELDDIEQILGSLDLVLGEMASGDMEGAVETALGMTGYDTVSSFSADLGMERSHTSATAVGQEFYTGNQESDPAVSSPGYSRIQMLVEKMMALMDEADEKIQKASRQPIDQLFAEHLKAIERPAQETDHGPDETDALKYEILTDLRQRMQLL